MAEIEIDRADLNVTVYNDVHETHETCLFIIHRRFDDPPQLIKVVRNEEERMVIYRQVRDEIHRFMCNRLTDLI